MPIYTPFVLNKFSVAQDFPNQVPNSNLKHPFSLSLPFIQTFKRRPKSEDTEKNISFVFLHQCILYRRLQLEEKEEQQSEDKVKVRSHDPPLLDLDLVLVLVQTVL